MRIEGSGAGSIPLTNGSGSATLQNSGVECSGRERGAGVGERGGATAPAPQGQAHQAAEARDRMQEGQISGQSKGHLFDGPFEDLTTFLYIFCEL